ncbi:MAG TPA: histidinol-phosphate transaminase [Hyalangium sp.]|nr:histidinol-phosphate transaminase [Hyalangium sp.]
MAESTGPLRPSDSFAAYLEHFVPGSYLEARAYNVALPSVPVRLDRNESPVDWPAHLKARVLEQVAASPWNRYSDPYASEETALVANSHGLVPEAVLLGPGSNALLALALDAFTRRGNTVVSAWPSFDWYPGCCNYMGVRQETWPLSEALEYEPALLPALRPGTVVVFASPNNPVGNLLRRPVLAELLARHPGTLFLADEAYVEFAGESVLELLADHGNLIVSRSLTKAAAAAGLRCAFMAGSPRLIELLRKKRAPFMLNHFSLAALRVLYTDPEVKAFVREMQQRVISERERLLEALRALETGGFRVVPSHANFVLVRWSDPAEAQRVYQELIDHGVRVANFIRYPQLEGSLRVTVGTPAENSTFLEALRAILRPR